MLFFFLGFEEIFPGLVDPILNNQEINITYTDLIKIDINITHIEVCKRFYPGVIVKILYPELPTSPPGNETKTGNGTESVSRPRVNVCVCVCVCVCVLHARMHLQIGYHEFVLLSWPYQETGIRRWSLEVNLQFVQ